MTSDERLDIGDALQRFRQRATYGWSSARGVAQDNRTTMFDYRRRSAITALVALSACSTPQAARTPARLSHADGDTIVMNSRGARPIPVHALDDAGHDLTVPLHFAQVSGDTLPLTANG